MLTYSMMTDEQIQEVLGTNPHVKSYLESYGWNRRIVFGKVRWSHNCVRDHRVTKDCNVVAALYLTGLLLDNMVPIERRMFNGINRLRKDTLEGEWDNEEAGPWVPTSRFLPKDQTQGGTL